MNSIKLNNSHLMPFSQSLHAAAKPQMIRMFHKIIIKDYETFSFDSIRER